MGIEDIGFNPLDLGTGIIMVRRYALYVRIGRDGHLCQFGIFRILLFDDSAQTASEQGHAREYLFGVLGSTGSQFGG